MARRRLFAASAERLNSLNEICATLVSWFNHAAGIGLLPPTCVIEADGTKLSLSARKVLKGLIEARGPSSGSGARHPIASPNTIAKTILEKKYLEETLGRENGRDDLLLFPDVAERLKAQAQRLRSEIEGLSPWVEKRDLHELVLQSFSMLETELISTHRISMPEDTSVFTEMLKTYAVDTIEQLIARYREFVPGGGAATEKELVELGFDGISAAICRREKATIGNWRKRVSSPRVAVELSKG